MPDCGGVRAHSKRGNTSFDPPKYGFTDDDAQDNRNKKPSIHKHNLVQVIVSKNFLVLSNENIHSQHQKVPNERGQSFYEPRFQIHLQGKCRISHSSSLNIRGLFLEFVKFHGPNPCCSLIGFVADGVHSNEGHCETIKDGEQEEAYAGAKGGAGIAYKGSHYQRFKLVRQVKESIPWNPGREPERVKANESVKGHHVHDNKLDICLYNAKI